MERLGPRSFHTAVDDGRQATVALDRGQGTVPALIEDHVGFVLREAREAVETDLHDVASSLRIRFVYLNAIEEGRFDDLPGTTYAIGFVRTYAEYLGLDSDRLVERFKSEVGDVGAPQQLEFPTPMPDGRFPGGTILALSVVLVVAAVGGWTYLQGRDAVVVERVAEPPQLVDSSGATPGSSGTGVRTVEPVLAPVRSVQATEPVGAGANADRVPPAAVAQSVASVEPTSATLLPEPATATAEPPAPVFNDEVASPPAPRADDPAADAVATASVVDPVSDPVAGPIVEAVEAPVGFGALPAPPTLAGPVDTPAAPTAVGPAVEETPQVAALPAPSPVSTPVQTRPPPAAVAVSASEPDDFGAPLALAPPAQRAAGSAEQTAIGAPLTLVPARPADRVPELESIPRPSAAIAVPPPAVAAPAVAAPTVLVNPLPKPPPTQLASLPDVPVAEGVSVNTGRVYGQANRDARIVLTATSDSWVQVRDGDQSVLLTRMLRTGDSYRVPNRADLFLLTGNAGALEIAVDGQIVPPIGPMGAVRRDMRLDADSLKRGLSAR